MKTFTKIMLCILTVSLFGLGNTLAFAKGGGSHDAGVGHGGPAPHGFTQGAKEGWKDKDTPPGWNHGKKTGWHGGKMPPGLTKKQEPGEEPGEEKEEQKN